jgi:hypothetical protein
MAISTRPDLSFITGKTFETMNQFAQFYEDANDEQTQIIDNAIMRIPELISIAEQTFDEKKNQPGLVFKIVEKVLNSIKK